MKHVPTVAGALLGLMFIAFSAMVLFKLVDVPPPEDDGTPRFHFMLAFGASGYVIFVKVCEMIGGILVAVPKTRAWGLLVLGPIILNILVYHFLFDGAASLINPILIAISALALYLLWVERRGFLGLLHR